MEELYSIALTCQRNLASADPFNELPESEEDYEKLFKRSNH